MYNKQYLLCSFIKWNEVILNHYSVLQVYVVYLSTWSPLRSTHFFTLCCSSKKSSTADNDQPHHQSDTASQPSVFFHVREQKIVRWCQIRRSTSSKPQSRTAAIATPDLYAGALSWWNRSPFVLNYLSSVGLSGRKQCS